MAIRIADKTRYRLLSVYVVDANISQSNYKIVLVNEALGCVCVCVCVLRH